MIIILWLTSLYFMLSIFDMIICYFEAITSTVMDVLVFSLPAYSRHSGISTLIFMMFTFIFIPFLQGVTSKR